MYTEVHITSIHPDHRPASRASPPPVTRIAKRGNELEPRMTSTITVRMSRTPGKARRRGAKAPAALFSFQTVGSLRAGLQGERPLDHLPDASNRAVPGHSTIISPALAGKRL